MTKTARLALAEQLLREHNTADWWDAPPADDLADARYAVVLARDVVGEKRQTWVTSADDAHELAVVANATLDAEYDVEWVAAVYDMTTCEKIDVKVRHTTTVVMPDETRHHCSTWDNHPTWVIVVRHPDFENGYDVIEGALPGVRHIDIDTGADFSNGRPSRYWCADRYFGLVDNEPDLPKAVKRKVLHIYKNAPGDYAEKHPKGVDPGTW